MEDGVCGCGADDSKAVEGMASLCPIHDGVSHLGEVYLEFHSCLFTFTHDSF